MPSVSNKPPDILEEFCTLTGMSPSNICHKPLVPSDDVKPSRLRGRPRGVKNRPKGVKIKVQSPGSASASAGAILKKLRNSKMVGKGRGRSDASPMEDGNGKRSNSSSGPVDCVLSKVLDRLAYDKSISEQMVFKEGVNDSDKDYSRRAKNNSNCLVDVNDGSFINNPIESVGDIVDSNLDLKNKGGGVDDCVDPSLVSNNASKSTMADVEHGVDESIRKTNKVELDSMNIDSGFVFGDVKRNKGILNRPPVGLTKVQFGPSLFYKSSNVWSSRNHGVGGAKSDGTLNIESFAEKMKKGVEDRELQMKFDPLAVSMQSNGTKRIAISMEDIKKGSEACALQLYGYFVGTSMDYRVVNANLSKMWRAYGISDITKTSAGLFYFKFKNEEGMKSVLESGPWMINNVPLVLNVWEPGIWLEKVEPSTIPIWVCVYGIPLELCNGNGIGKIMSGVGKPMLMDKLTRERCLKKSGKLDFARVLVEVSASDVLPNELEIEYPAIGDKPGRIGKLNVKYQWKPPQCSFCKTFGHATVACKLRPRTGEEIAAKILKDALKVNKPISETEVGGNDDNAGFIEVGKKNKPVGGQSFVKQNGYHNRGVNNSFQSRGFQNSSRFNVNNGRFNYASRGSYQQDRNGFGGVHNYGNGLKAKGMDESSSKEKGNVNMKSKVDVVPPKKSVKQNDDKSGLVQKPSLSSKYNADFKPKVLVRGSGSNKPLDVKGENVPVNNSFQALEDLDMVDKDDCFLKSVDDEYKSVVWPKLQCEVEEVMKSGVYPSESVRSNWSLSQLDFFYNNCSKYGMEPYVEDDDVESEDEGMAVEMKSDVVNDCVSQSVDIGTASKSVINES